jgi:hypothetical protein
MNAFHRIKHFLPFCVTFILAFPQKGSIAELERKIAPKPILLGFWEEAVGTLHRLTGDEGVLLAEIGPVAVYLPLELEGQLRPNVGKRIAILRIDDPIKPYRIRVPR